MGSFALWMGLVVAGQVAPPAGHLPAEVKRLVHKLDSDSLAERKDAEKALVKLGPDILPLLPASGEPVSAEVAERLSAVRQALTAAQVQRAAQASRVTLSARQMPLVEIFAALEKQTGNKIVFEPGQNGDQSPLKLDLALDQAPFWNGLDKILDLAQLTVNNYANQPGLEIVARAPGQLPRLGRAVYPGPFRIEATRIEAVRDLRNPASHVLKVTLEVSWEPRLKPIAIIQDAKSLRAVDDRGVRLTGQDPSATAEALPGDQASAAEIELALQPSPLRARKLARLAGSLAALVRGPAEAFRFESLPVATNQAPAKRVQLRKADVTVSVDYLRKNNDAWELQMRVRFDRPHRALDSYLSGWIASNEAVWVGPAGETIAPGTFEMTEHAENEIGMKYLFSLPQGPAGLAFVYKTPLAILDVPVDFELRDLELP